MSELFDPSTNTVDQVNAYLSTASPEEVARVLEAEANGKNRATVSVPPGTKVDNSSEGWVCPLCFPNGIPEGYIAVGCGHSQE